MAYSITKDCIQCDSCIPKCPVGAIKRVNDDYWIDPTICNGCEGYYDEPQCVTSCPVDSTVPFQAKKGRSKKQDRPTLSLELFLNEKNHSFASAIVMWELCNVLTQRLSLPWHTTETGEMCYERRVNRGRGLLQFWITPPPDGETITWDTTSSGASDEGSFSQTPGSSKVGLGQDHGSIEGQAADCLDQASATAAIANLDVRAACLHLIYAAYATGVDRPWEEEFVFGDRQIERYLGLDKRKDLSKLEKLRLIRDLVQQPCQLLATINWPAQGKIPGFSCDRERLWHLADIHHHFEEDELGCKHLVGLTFRIRAGIWAQHFLNQQGYWDRSAFYQYGSLPSCLLPEVMSNWQQHEGAMRMLLWLLFKTKMGHDQPITAQTLMRIAYGEERLVQANDNSAIYKRLLKTFECDLETLYYYGLKPVFDPKTYPPEIQPLWAKLAELPDDAEEALKFWTEDGSQNQRLTDSAPRGKWKRVLNARLLRFDLPDTWETRQSRRAKSKHKRNLNKNVVKKKTFSGAQVIAARKRLKISQRALAEQVGKSQSWIRDIEKGRFEASPKDQQMLSNVLKF